MCGELPRVGHLVEDEPTAEILPRQLRLLGPLLDVGLDQVEALARDRFRAEQLWVLLAEDSATEETQH